MMHNRAAIKNQFPYGMIIIGGFISGLFFLIAGISIFWTPHSYLSISIADRFLPSSFQFWLGTDQFGRDILSMLMAGAQNTIITASAAVALGMLIGVPLGLIASISKKSADSMISGVSDIFFAFPGIITAIILSSIYGPGLINAVIAIGIFNIPVFIRITRNSALPVWSNDYITAARVTGLNQVQISRRHILPNIAHILIIQGTTQFAMAILAEAGLSYLGLSIQPPHPTWGKMLYDAQTFFTIHPTLALYPGLAIMLCVLGLNLFSEGLRKMIGENTGPFLLRE